MSEDFKSLDNVEVLTLHAFAYQYARKLSPNQRLNLDKNLDDCINEDYFFIKGIKTDYKEKFSEARERKIKYEQLYYDFFDQAIKINDWRKLLGDVPIPEGCTDENMTIPDTSGSIDWNGEEDPVPIPIESDLIS